MGCLGLKMGSRGDFGSIWGVTGGFEACSSSYDVADGVGMWQVVYDASAGVDVAAGFGVLLLSNGAGAGLSTGAGGCRCCRMRWRGFRGVRLNGCVSRWAGLRDAVVAVVSCAACSYLTDLNPSFKCYLGSCQL
jgi:hypothetical protein